MQGPCGRLLLDHWDEGAVARCTCFPCDFRWCKGQLPSLKILHCWLDMSDMPPLSRCHFVASKCVNFHAFRDAPTTQCHFKISVCILWIQILAEKVHSSKLKTEDGRWWRWLRKGSGPPFWVFLLGQSLKVVLLSIATDGAGWWSESFIWLNTHQWDIVGWRGTFI